MVVVKGTSSTGVEGRSSLNAKEEVGAVSQQVLEGAVAATEGWEQALTGKEQEGIFWDDENALY